MNALARRLPDALPVLALAASLSLPAAAVEDDPVLATVNGHPIRESYVYAQIESLPLGEQLAIRQQFERFTDSVIKEEVLFQFVLASEFEADPALRERVKRLVVDHVIRREVTARIDVSESDVRAYYDQNSSAIRGEAVRASQIVLAERSACEALAARIGSDAEFAEAAGQLSLDRASAQRAGDIGYFMNHPGPFGFEPELFELDPGEMRIFESSSGCHLVRVTERESPPLPPLEAVQERIRTLLERRRERDLLGELFERAQRGVEVEYGP